MFYSEKHTLHRCGQENSSNESTPSNGASTHYYYYYHYSMRQKKRKKKQYRATNSNIGCRTPQNGMREGVINHQNGGHVDLIGHQWESGQDFSIAKQNVPHIWCRPYAAKFRLWGRTTMVMECYRRAKTGTDRRHLSQNRVCGWWAWRL